MTLTFSIMAHASRYQYVETLLLPSLELGADVSVDDGSLGLWANARRAWKQGLMSDHHCVLQDDIEVCERFQLTARYLIQLLPDAVISFFNPYRAATDRAREAGSSWLLADKVWGQAVLMPSYLIRNWLEWDAEHVKPDYSMDDARLSLFLLTHHIPIWHTIPCLVEHLGAQHSLVGNHPPIDRAASWFIGREKNGLTINWRAGLDKPIRRMTNRLSDYESMLMKRVA